MNEQQIAPTDRPQAYLRTPARKDAPDGYPSAVVPDLLAVLAWSRRRGDVEYETANFLYWSKRELGASEQLGFGVCANDELHGDIEYYYVVRYDAGGCTISAHEVEHED